MQKSKTAETSLVLTTGFLIVFLIAGNKLFLGMAIAFGVIGVFVKPLANYITFLWFKLADALNFIVSKIVLGTLFYLVVFPISVIYKITNKDKLQLNRSVKSTWIKRDKKYTTSDLENIW